MSESWSIAKAFRPRWHERDGEAGPSGGPTLDGRRRPTRATRIELAIIISCFGGLILSHSVELPLWDRSRPAVWWSAFAFYFRTFQFHLGCVGILWAAGCAIRKRLGLAALVALFATTSIIPEARGLWPATPFRSLPTDLRIVSVNQLRTNQDARRTLVGIFAEKPDVIAIQEYSQSHDEQFSRALAGRYPYAARFPHPISNGLAVYSRYPLTLDDAPAENFGGGRLMSVTVSIDDRRVRLFNIHPTSPGLPSRIAANRMQIAELVSSINREQLPTIVVGDCNFTLNSQQAHALCRAGLRPAEDWGGGVRWSWSPVRDAWPVLRIDHAFVSDDFSVQSDRTGGAVGSDHRPIVVDLAFK